MAKRPRNLRDMLTGQNQQQNIIPQLVATGGGGGFGYAGLPGAPANPPDQGGGDMSGITALLKKLLGQGDGQFVPQGPSGQQGTEPGSYGAQGEYGPYIPSDVMPPQWRIK